MMSPKETGEAQIPRQIERISAWYDIVRPQYRNGLEKYERNYFIFFVAAILSYGISFTLILNGNIETNFISVSILVVSGLITTVIGLQFFVDGLNLREMYFVTKHGDFPKIVCPSCEGEISTTTKYRCGSCRGTIKPTLLAGVIHECCPICDEKQVSLECPHCSTIIQLKENAPASDVQPATFPFVEKKEKAPSAEEDIASRIRGDNLYAQKFGKKTDAHRDSDGRRG